MQKAGGYELVDHILTNGLAYIDTGYCPTYYTEVEMFCRMEPNEITPTGLDVCTFFSTILEESRGCFQFNHGSTAGENGVRFFSWPNRFYGQGGNIRQLLNENYLYSNVLLGWKFVDGIYTAYVGEISTNIDNPLSYKTPLRLFMNYSGMVYDKTSLYFYSFKISERGTLVKHFVPAKKGDIYGMAEIIEGKFYASPNVESFDY